MNQIYIGNSKDHPVLAYENALLCYVYGRVTLNTEGFLFLLPSTLYLFHQAVEISIKTLFRIKNFPYKNYGPEGHKIHSLLTTAVGSKLFSERLNYLLNNKDLIEILKAMDTTYLGNKYEYPEYNLIGVPLRDSMDDIIYIIFEEVNLILKSNNHALAVLNVPESCEKLFLHKLKHPISYCALRSRED